MSPLTANLKHLYQCRKIMLTNLVFIPIILLLPVLLHKTGEEKAMAMGFAMIYYASFSNMISRLAADTFSKPFSYCLPNHEKTVHKMLLLLWVVIAASFLLVTAGLSFFSPPFNLDLLFGIISLLSLGYWMGAACLIRGWQHMFSIFLMAGLLDIHTHFLESVLTGHPWLVGTFCCVVSVFIYGSLAGRRKGRALCDKPLPMNVPLGRGRKIDFFPGQRAGNKTPSRSFTSLSPFFLDRIRSENASELRTGLLGQVYLLLGVFPNRWKMILLFPILFPFLPHISIQSEITAQSFIGVIVPVIMGVIGGGVCTIHHTEHITLQSRKVVFIRGITVTLASALAITFVLALAIFLNNLLFSLLPGISIMGETFQIVPASWITIAFTAPLVPLFGGIMILFKQYFSRAIVLSFTVVAVMIISSISIIAAVMIISFNSIIAMEKTPPGVVLAGFVIATAITWVFHLGVLYFDSMKRSLC